MGKSINTFELDLAHVVIQPELKGMRGTDFKARNAAILAGEESAMKQMSQIKNLLKI
jgi:NTE family protein